jgi:flavin reductase (DIM6/NTAB) family NADH-FMN oxidoreductase RutF
MKTFDFQQLPTSDIYQLMIGIIAPRPIAFVSTISEDGIPNLAPYSYFNAFSSDPPIVIFSSNIQDGDPPKKDTLRNVEAVPEVVINMVNYDIVRQMAISSIAFDAAVSEFEKAGLTPIKSELVRPFRVQESPVQMECRVQQIMPLGTAQGAGNLVVCEVLKVHVNETVLDEKNRINPHRLDLMGRMGRTYYVRASGEAIHSVYQSRQQLTIGFNALPESAKASNVLTGNDLAQLAGLEVAPTLEELSSFQKDNKILQHLLQSEEPRHALHLRAKKLLASEQVEKAARFVWIADQLEAS